VRAALGILGTVLAIGASAYTSSSPFAAGDHSLSQLLLNFMWIVPFSVIPTVGKPERSASVVLIASGYALTAIGAWALTRPSMVREPEQAVALAFIAAAVLLADGLLTAFAAQRARDEALARRGPTVLYERPEVVFRFPWILIVGWVVAWGMIWAGQALLVDRPAAYGLVLAGVVVFLVIFRVQARWVGRP
jgi:hypothetical protein